MEEQNSSHNNGQLASVVLYSLVAEGGAQKMRAALGT
jgi:hypothetical protein